MAEVSGDSVITLDEFRDHMRSHSSATDFDARATEAINAATAEIARATGRRLRSFVYRVPVTFANLAFQNTDPDTAESLVSGSSGVFSAIRTDDAVAGTNLPLEARVAFVDQSLDGVYIAPGYSEDMSLTPPTLTFGTSALYASGDGSSVIYCPEWPVVELLRAEYRDGALWYDLDITDYYAAPGLSRIELRNAAFPQGTANIRLEVRAGYRKPTSREVGDAHEWLALRRMWLRAAEVFYSDDSILRGRAASFGNLRGGTERALEASALPTDVEAMLAPFVRWA